MPKIPTRDEMRARMRAMQRKIGSKPVVGPVFNLALGLGVTLRTMSKRSVTQQYPKEKPDLPPRTRGVIALKEENCTVCMLCSRECPDWCIYIDSHKEVMPPKEAGARARTRNVLDRFAIDYALCMYCGICVEVCPFDALFWAPHFEYSTFDITELTHEMPQLGEWMDYVEPPPPFEEGAEPAKEEAAEPKAIGAAVAAPPPSAAPAVEAAGSTAPSEAPAEPPTAPAAEPHEREEPEIDEEVFQRETAAGKPERVARALAKRAWIVKRRQQKGGG